MVLVLFLRTSHAFAAAAAPLRKEVRHSRIFFLHLEHGLTLSVRVFTVSLAVNVPCRSAAYY